MHGAKVNKATIEDISQNHPIILFDGECILCNHFIQRIIKHDRHKIFRFITLQSSIGIELSSGVAGDKDTVILMHKKEIFTESDVSLKSASILGGWYSLARVLYIIPSFIRNPIYRFISRNRYRWFGKRETCMIPDENFKERFIS